VSELAKPAVLSEGEESLATLRAGLAAFFWPFEFTRPLDVLFSDCAVEPILEILGFLGD
jgi:hypothetical protein